MQFFCSDITPGQAKLKERSGLFGNLSTWQTNQAQHPQVR